MKLSAALCLVGIKLAAATVQGFDISNYQPSVNFAAAYNSGARFVIIKVRNYLLQESFASTELKSAVPHGQASVKRERIGCLIKKMLISYNRPLRVPVIFLLPSQVSTQELPMLVSSAAGTTSLIPIRAPAQPKQTTSLPTAEVGPVME